MTKAVVAGVLLAFCAQAHANNEFIPNYYRNRRAPNAFSAIGWSDRKEAGLNYENIKTSVDSNGARTENIEQNDVFGHAFYRLPSNINLEGRYARDVETMQYTKTDHGYKDTYNTIELNAGAELTAQPLAFGVSYFDQRGTNNVTPPGLRVINSDKKFLALGAGYRLAGQNFIGLGVSTTQYERSNTADRAAADFYVGGGKVSGDLKAPDAAGEVALHYSNLTGNQLYELQGRGLINLHEFQYYGAFTLSRQDGPADGNSYSLTAGLDYQIGQWFIGPQAELLRTQVRTSETTEEHRMIVSLEGGYRSGHWEAFARYSPSQDDTEFTQTTSTTSRNLSTLEIGGTYFF